MNLSNRGPARTGPRRFHASDQGLLAAARRRGLGRGRRCSGCIGRGRGRIRRGCFCRSRLRRHGLGRGCCRRCSGLGRRCGFFFLRARCEQQGCGNDGDRGAHWLHDFLPVGCLARRSSRKAAARLVEPHACQQLHLGEVCGLISPARLSPRPEHGRPTAVLSAGAGLAYACGGVFATLIGRFSGTRKARLPSISAGRFPLVDFHLRQGRPANFTTLPFAKPHPFANPITTLLR